MVYRNEKYREKLSNLKKGSFSFIIDFDRTITTSNSPTTWGVIKKCHLFTKQYDIEQEALYNYYRKIEIDETIEKELKMVALDDWQRKHVELFKKYHLNTQHINDIFSRNDTMMFRKDAPDFFNFSHNEKINIKILSAGIRDFIVSFLKNNNCLFENIDIISNSLDFDDKGLLIGLKGTAIHSLNKNEFSNIDCNDDYIILIGDQLSDIMMAKDFNRNKTIAIAFVAWDNISEIAKFKEIYDMVLTDEEGFGEIIDDLKSVLY